MAENIQFTELRALWQPSIAGETLTTHTFNIQPHINKKNELMALLVKEKQFVTAENESDW